MPVGDHPTADDLVEDIQMHEPIGNDTTGIIHEAAGGDGLENPPISHTEVVYVETIAVSACNYVHYYNF